MYLSVSFLFSPVVFLLFLIGSVWKIIDKRNCSKWTQKRGSMLFDSKIATVFAFDDKTFHLLEQFFKSLFFCISVSRQWMDFFLVLRNGFFTIFPVSVVPVISVTMSNKIVDVRNDEELIMIPKYVKFYLDFISILSFFTFFCLLNFMGFVWIHYLVFKYYARRCMMCFLRLIYLKFSSGKKT